MLFAVRFVDHPDRQAVRAAHLPEHIAWLHDSRDHVLVAGSLRSDCASAPIGGLWIVEAPDRDAVKVLVAADPFWQHGLRAQMEILHWSKAFPDRHVAI